MVPAIYQIRNLKTNEIYIGSTLNFVKRFRAHLRLLNLNKHHSYLLQTSWNKYGGKSSFSFEVLEFCTKNLVVELEQLYLDKYKPTLNVAGSAHAPMLGKKHSNESKNKMRAWKRPKGKSHHFFGKKLSKEHILKLRLKRKDRKWSNETKEKMKQTAIRNNQCRFLKDSIERFKKPIIDNYGRVFASRKEAANFHNISQSTICDILKGRHKQTRNGVSFKDYSNES